MFSVCMHYWVLNMVQSFAITCHMLVTWLSSCGKYRHGMYLYQSVAYYLLS